MKQQVIPDCGLVRELIARHIQQANKMQMEQLITYYEMLIERNNVMNLTAVTDPEGVVLRHFADSILPMEAIAEGASVIDVGTGAGLPGVPLKIMRPDIELTLLDSLNKRIAFLDEVNAALSLGAVTVHARAEDGGRDKNFRERFDHALSRAVAELRVVAEWTLPFVKVGGSSLMYKGPGAADELENAENALKILNAKAKILRFEPEWGERNIVVAEKTAPTPAKYPRKAGTAGKNPL